MFPGNVRKLYNCGDSYWSDSGYSLIIGHRYLALNFLGRSSKTPEQLIRSVKANLGAVFPGGATGKDGPSVTLGNIFLLGPLGFPVLVVAVDAWSFTLKTQPGHPLVGTARHAVIKDTAGELWLMQEGQGDSRVETLMNFTMNYFAAPKMWRAMAKNIKRLYMK